MKASHLSISVIVVLNSRKNCVGSLVNAFGHHGITHFENVRFAVFYCHKSISFVITEACNIYII